MGLGVFGLGVAGVLLGGMVVVRLWRMSFGGTWFGVLRGFFGIWCVGVELLIGGAVCLLLCVRR